MIDRKSIENILKLNGLSSSSPDDEIKSLLLSARWHADDVETALVVLREDPRSKAQHIDSIHNVFNSDAKFNPETLNAILGIDVEINEVTKIHHKALQKAYRMQIISLAIVSALIATLFIVASMWVLQLGFFNIYV